MTVRTFTAGVLAVALVVGPVWQAVGQTAKPGAADVKPMTKVDPGSAKFLTKAIEGNYAETALGKLAQQQATNEQVKTYGKMLETDHSAANTKATDVARSLGLTPPAETSKKNQQMYDQMAKLKGQQFDQQFAKHMVDDHKKDVRDYEKQTTSKNSAVATYAKETLPTLRKHLDDATSLNKTVSAPSKW